MNAELERQRALHQFRQEHLEQEMGGQRVPKADKIVEWSLLEIVRLLSVMNSQLGELRVEAAKTRAAHN